MADDFALPLSVGLGQFDPRLVYDPVLKRAQAQAQAAQQAKDPYTPEQIAQRQDQNQTAQNVAMLAMLSGDDRLSGFGAQVFKQALGEKQEKVTDRGVYNPMSGQWTLDPAYQREQAQNDLDKVYGQIAQAQAGELGRRETQADALARLRMEQSFQEGQNRLGREANAPLEQIIDPVTHQPKYVLRANAVGMQPYNPAQAGTASGELLKAAGFGDMMMRAGTIINALEDFGVSPPAKADIAGALPGKLGQYAARATLTPQQLQYRQAQEQWVRNKLRKESGAKIDDSEIAGEITTYFPQPRDPKELREQKRNMRAAAEADMMIQAGSAAKLMPGNTGGAPGAPTADDPLGARAHL